MVAVIKQVVTVQAGGLIEIRSSQLKPGSQAEVTVSVDEANATSHSRRSLASFVGSGKGAFKSAAEIDAYINEIRDWGDRDR